jgi:hypothetical protein
MRFFAVIGLAALLSSLISYCQSWRDWVRPAPPDVQEGQREVVPMAEATPRLSPHMRQMVAAQGGSEVPVLVPYEQTQDKRQAEAHQFRLKITDQGYTARLVIETLDVVIYGTRVVYAQDGRQDHTAVDYIRPYQGFSEENGGSISFGRFGADYHIEFYCLNGRGLHEAGCIDGQGAREFIENLP